MLTRLACLMLLAAGLALPALAQDKPIQLKISLWLPPAHPLVVTTKEWATSLEAASGGTIKSTIFPSEQLGKAFDHYDMVRDGIADVGYINPGYQPGRFPVINAAQLPFMLTNGVAASAAVDAWYRAYAAREMPDTQFCMAFVHDPGTLHSRKRITVPADLRGAKVRPSHAMMGEFVSLLGGANVQASAPEARDVLDRGVADAIAFPYGSVFLFGIDRVVKFHLDAPLYTSVFTISINKAKYDGASPSQRAAIDAHCTSEWAQKLAAPWAAFEAAGRERMRGTPGHKMVALTPAQLAEWRAAAEPLWQSWAASVRKVGVDPDAALDALKAGLAAQASAY